MSGAATEAGVYLGKARGRRIVHKPARFERPEVAQAESKVRTALHAAFLKMKPKVVAHVRRELDRVMKSYNPDQPRDDHGKFGEGSSDPREADLRAKADALKAMPEAQRENVDIYEHGFRAYVLYEAEANMPAKDGAMRSVNDSNTMTLSQEADAVANVGGKAYLASKDEDPDDEERHVWTFYDPARPFTDLKGFTTDFDDKKEAVRQFREHIGKVTKAAGDPDDELWIMAGDVVERLEMEDFAFVIDEVGSGLDVVASTAARETLGTIGVDDSAIVDQIDQAAADWAKDRAAELVGMRYDAEGNIVEAARAEMRIDESTRDMIRQSVYDGLQDGLRSGEIADEIEAGAGVGGYVFSEERAALIANTEIRRAHNEGSLAGMRGAEDAGVEVRKQWITSGHDTVCEDCQGNADDGEIDVDDEFSSGDDSAPAHPNCNCDVVAVTGPKEAEDDPGAGDDEDDSGEKAARTEASLEKIARAGTARLLEAANDRLAVAGAKLASASADLAELNLRIAEQGARLTEREDALRKAEAGIAVERSAREAAERALADRNAIAEMIAKSGDATTAALGGAMTKLDATLARALERTPRRVEMEIERLPGGKFLVVKDG